MRIESIMAVEELSVPGEVSIGHVAFIDRAQL